MNRLARLRLLARAALLTEAVWPALWPPLAVAGLFVCAALLELPARLPFLAHAALLIGTAAVILLLGARGFRSLRFPSQADADRRLEADSGLPHRPLQVLADRPAQADAGAVVLWEAHVARATALLARIRVTGPRPGLARRDPRAFRNGLAVAVLACLTVAGNETPHRLSTALWPQMPVTAPPAPAEVHAWITPPAYTRLPPQFLHANAAQIAVPGGSHLTVNLTGADGPATLRLDQETQPFQALDAASLQAERMVVTGGRLTVLLGTRDMGHWDLTVVADAPPTAAWSADPGRLPGSDETRLPWIAEDDYGVVSLQVLMRLAEAPDAAPMIVPVPLAGGVVKAGKGVSQQDLTAHVWAGLPVLATLEARDALGQIGRSAQVRFDLPERAFQNPIAQALIAIRKGLTLHPADRGEEMAALDALMMHPDAFGDDFGAFLNLSGIYYRLVRGRDEAVPEAQDRLWALALHMEEGRSEPTARSVEVARQAARDALDAFLKDPSDHNRDVLDERLQALEEAIDRHMQSLTEAARPDGDTAMVDRDGKPVARDDLDRAAERARDAAREGRPADAQQRMAELERMLDRLREARPGQKDQVKAEKRQRGRQQMGAVQDMIAREGGLLDHTERRVDQRRRYAPAPQGTDPAAERNADQRVQMALRRALGELMQQFGDLTGEVPPSLGEADQAMRDAGRQFNEGEDRSASESVQVAIEALQKGGREMGQIVARQFGPPRPGGGDEAGEDDLFGMTMPGGQRDGRGGGPSSRNPGRADASGRDPLGRPSFGEGGGGGR